MGGGGNSLNIRKKNFIYNKKAPSSVSRIQGQPHHEAKITYLAWSVGGVFFPSCAT